MLTFLAVWQPVLQVEWAVSKDLVAVGAGEALGVEGGRHRLQAVLGATHAGGTGEHGVASAAQYSPTPLPFMPRI